MNTPCKPETWHVKDLYAVYPVHIRRFISRFGLTTLEMTEILGLPSVQEWYRLKKHEHERVRNTVVCSLLRAYTEHPDWLLANRITFKDVANRLYWVLRENGARRRTQIVYAVCQLFDKSQHVLKNWFTGVKEPDQASQRMIEVIMKLDNKELYDFICDSRLSAITQVYGKDIAVVVDQTGAKMYSIQGEDELYTLEEIAHKSPLPGSRRTHKDYAENSSPAHTGSAENEGQSSKLPETIKKSTKMLENLPWG